MRRPSSRPIGRTLTLGNYCGDGAASLVCSEAANDTEWSISGCRSGGQKSCASACRAPLDDNRLDRRNPTDRQVSPRNQRHASAERTTRDEAERGDPFETTTRPSWIACSQSAWSNPAGTSASRPLLDCALSFLGCCRCALTGFTLLDETFSTRTDFLTHDTRMIPEVDLPRSTGNTRRSTGSVVWLRRGRHPPPAMNHSDHYSRKLRSTPKDRLSPFGRTPNLPVVQQRIGGQIMTTQ